jgi:hypothetical protein
MILFICFYVLFFALLGFRIFRGSVEGVSNFPDYIDSSFNMLVLLTTANSPDIMLPAYEYSRPLALFFIVYLLFGVFLLMNLLMALFYSNYKDRLTKQMKEFHTERDQYLEEKFDELDKEQKGYLNKQETFEMFKQIHQLDQSMKQSKDQPFTIQHFDRMFYLLNTKDLEVSKNNINGSSIVQSQGIF